ncbi:uncharacterized protein PAC_15217 [Phialocephala subalpina]|uniref:Uncharacterized protein n=1 Tax=Phialocephala subalpina TaxID=576137 RepID=A0A1L7XK43_9HELO|nr:uncharacterized protein PAC_15217 [Phialocephala subalpina]
MMPNPIGSAARPSAFDSTSAALNNGQTLLPYLEDENAESRLSRVIELMNPARQGTITTESVCRDIILTLLQCAGRLYGGGTFQNEAALLIQNADFFCILRYGVQDKLNRVINDGCMANVTSETTNLSNHLQRARLFSTIRKNEAHKSSHQAMVLEHLVSIFKYNYPALLGKCIPPTTNESWLFKCCLALLTWQSSYEKAWLISMLPDVFMWSITGPPGSLDVVQRESEALVGVEQNRPVSASEMQEQDAAQEESPTVSIFDLGSDSDTGEGQAEWDLVRQNIFGEGRGRIQELQIASPSTTSEASYWSADPRYPSSV